MVDTVIIGAGLTGLATAYYLEQNGFTDYLIFEKETEIGGLCRSIRQDGFTFDYTGHLIHINDQIFQKFLDETMTLSSLNILQRRSQIFSNNCFTHYPFQTNLHGLPIQVIAECIEGFIKRKSIKNPKTFYHWTMKHFGKGFTKHFFLPYQQKLFCYNPKKITASWTGRFVPQTDLKSIIKGTLNESNDQRGYNASFYYPHKGGIDNLIHAIAHKIPISIKTHYEVKKIDIQRKIIYFINGETIRYNTMINTMPLNELLKKIQDKSSTQLQPQHRHLKTNSVLNVNLGIKRPHLADYHWCYFPEKQFPFYRLGFSHHFSPTMAPPNTSALYAECAYINKEKPNPEIILKKIQDFLNIKKSEIITQHQLHIPHAYVIYNSWREKNLSSIIAKLTENNIYSIGRYGAWKYSSMQESIIDGKQTAERLLPVYTKKEKAVELSQ